MKEPSSDNLAPADLGLGALPCSAVIMWSAGPENVCVWSYNPGVGALVSSGERVFVLRNIKLLKAN